MSATATPSASIPASDELTSSVDALPALCEDIASFLTSMSALSDPQKMATLESTVQGMLARLDEFGALASTIQNSTQQTKELSPDLLARAAELEALYVKIDRLEAYIAKMCEAMDALEDRQKEVKGVYGKNQVKKMFTSLMSRVTKTKQEPDSVVWQPITCIPQSKDYFQPPPLAEKSPPVSPEKKFSKK